MIFEVICKCFLFVKDFIFCVVVYVVEVFVRLVKFNVEDREILFYFIIKRVIVNIDLLSLFKEIFVEGKGKKNMIN